MRPEQNKFFVYHQDLAKRCSQIMLSEYLLDHDIGDGKSFKDVIITLYQTLEANPFYVELSSEQDKLGSTNLRDAIVEQKLGTFCSNRDLILKGLNEGKFNDKISPSNIALLKYFINLEIYTTCTYLSKSIPYIINDKKQKKKFDGYAKMANDALIEITKKAIEEESEEHLLKIILNNFQKSENKQTIALVFYRKMLSNPDCLSDAVLKELSQHFQKEIADIIVEKLPLHQEKVANLCEKIIESDEKDVFSKLFNYKGNDEQNQRLRIRAQYLANEISRLSSKQTSSEQEKTTTLRTLNNHIHAFITLIEDDGLTFQRALAENTSLKQGKIFIKAISSQIDIVTKSYFFRLETRVTAVFDKLMTAVKTKDYQAAEFFMRELKSAAKLLPTKKIPWQTILNKSDHDLLLTHIIAKRVTSIDPTEKGKSVLLMNQFLSILDRMFHYRQLSSSEVSDLLNKPFFGNDQYQTPVRISHYIAKTKGTPHEKLDDKFNTLLMKARNKRNKRQSAPEKEGGREITIRGK